MTAEMAVPEEYVHRVTWFKQPPNGVTPHYVKPRELRLVTDNDNPGDAASAIDTAAPEVDPEAAMRLLRGYMRIIVTAYCAEDAPPEVRSRIATVVGSLATGREATEPTGQDTASEMTMRKTRDSRRSGTDAPVDETLTDHELLPQLIAGNGMALARLVERHHRYLMGIAKRMIPDEADDMVQETYIRAWQRLQGSNDLRFQRDNGARAWLSIILRNVAFDRTKSAQYQREQCVGDIRELERGSMMPEPETQLIDSMMSDYAAGLLLRSLRGLSDNQARTMYALAFGGLSVEETATMLDCKPGAVKALRHRARARLQPIFESHGYKPRRRRRQAEPESQPGPGEPAS